MSEIPRKAVAAGGATLLLAATAAAQPALEHLVSVSGSGDGIAFSNPRGIAIDSGRGEIVVANTSAHRVEVFSASGRSIFRILHSVTTPEGAAADGYPVSVAVDRSGRLLVVDILADYVDVLNARGRSVEHIRLPGGARPVAVAVARDGAILVGEGGDGGRVHVFSPELQPLASWSLPDPGPEHAPIRALADTPDGHIVVLRAAGNPIVQTFTKGGEFVRGFGRIDSGAENFSLASGVAVTDDGRFWITDEIRQRIQVYQPDGLFLEAIAGWDVGAGDFLYPSAIATDGRSRIAVVERVAGRYRLLGLPSAREGARP